MPLGELRTLNELEARIRVLLRGRPLVFQFIRQRIQRAASGIKTFHVVEADW